MSKNKKNKKNSAEKINDKNFVDEQILSRAIVKAYFEIEDKKKENEQNHSENERKEWLEFLGQKEYPENENRLKKSWHKICNDFRLLMKLLFISRKDVKKTRAIRFKIFTYVVGW